MNQKGFSQTIIFAFIGVVVLGGVIGYSIFSHRDIDSMMGNVSDTTYMEAEGDSMEVAEEAHMPAAEKPASHTTNSNASSSQSSGTMSGGTASSSGTTTTTPQPTVETPQQETPAPSVPYTPSFQANVRVTPEIPSENERATLPACDTKLFTLSPVDFSSVTSIVANGKFSLSHPDEYARFTFPGTGVNNLYNLYAPADVWITNVVQENGITTDPEDDTIYFALCRDVIGYVTHVKELAPDIYKLVTDTTCLGKPQTGENACKIEVLKLVGKGSLLGKTGRLEGSFGFGVIDLRKERGLSNPYNYPIKTNFAACPFAYFTSPEGFMSKLTTGGGLCGS